MNAMVKLCVLRCVCGCGRLAVSIGDRRVTDSDSGGPWTVILEQDVKASEIVAGLPKEH